MNRFLAGCLCVILACAAGCQSSSFSSTTTTTTTRPVVHDERGAAVSELIFPPEQREVVLPLRFDAGLLFTDDVKINGQHVGSFIIDTGAMCSALDREVAEKLGLMRGKRLRDLKNSRLHRPDGLYHIDGLDIVGGGGGGGGGDDRRSVGVRNHVIAVVDLSSVRQRRGSHVAGVIGADVWALMPFTLDYHERHVVFHARPSFRPPPADRAVGSSLLVRRALKAPSPFSLANPRAGAPSVPVKINGEVVDAMLDTASGSAIVLLPKLAAQRPQWVRGDRVVARVSGAGGNVGLAGYGLVGARIESVDALGVRFTDIDSAFAILDQLPRDDASAIIGTRLLRHLRLTFDYAQQKVWAEVK